MSSSSVDIGGPSRVTALPIRTTQQPNLHEHSPDPGKESRKRVFGFSERAMGPGGERALRLIAADNPAPRRAYAFRRLLSNRTPKSRYADERT
jgi:hypothetical protein